MPRNTLESQLASAQHDLGLAEAHVKELEKEHAAVLSTLEAERKLRSKSLEKARVHHEKTCTAAIRKAGFTGKRGRKKLQKFAGLSNADVEAGAAEVPGHDLLGDAHLVVCDWIRKTAPECVASRTALRKARDRERETQHRIDDVRIPIREAENVVNRRRWAVRAVEEKIQKRADAKARREAKVRDVGSKATVEAHKEARRKLRKLTEKKVRYYEKHAPRLDSDTLKALGLR